jgi:hypothetical protein
MKVFLYWALVEGPRRLPLSGVVCEHEAVLSIIRRHVWILVALHVSAQGPQPFISKKGVKV